MDSKSLKRIRKRSPRSLKRQLLTKMQKIEYVTYHRGHGAPGVPKLAIRSPGLNKENKKEKSEIIKEAAPNNLKHRHQSDDETVEENKMQKIE